MAVRILSLVWDGYPGGGTELLALLALADWSDDAGKCYPSISAIARKTRLSRSQAQRIVHQLIDDGFLVVTANALGGAPTQTRHYRIVLDRLTGRADATPTNSTHATGSVHATGRTHAQEGSHPCGERGSTHATQTVSEPSVHVNYSVRAIASPDADPRKRLFDLGVSILTQAGDSEKAARSFLAKFAKQDEGKLGEVLGHLAAHPKVEPKSYIAGAFKPETRELVL